jgi:hypothetical protein
VSGAGAAPRHVARRARRGAARGRPAARRGRAAAAAAGFRRWLSALKTDPRGAPEGPAARRRREGAPEARAGQ